MRIALLPIAAVAAVLLAGCGGDDSSSSSSSAPATPQTGTVDVGMNRLKFDPDAITVKTGAKVVWTDKENVPHNVVANEGADFKSDVFNEGETYAWTADKAGTVKYECTLHPGMDGTITVVD
ncbi:MAG: plastocyanin/azurin family copper-binding protein [Solirubrobacteraceae bacterium]